MGTRRVSLGRLWFTTEGSGKNCPYFKRTRWEPIEMDLPEEFAPEQPEKDRWSISTEAGETFEP